MRVLLMNTWYYPNLMGGAEHSVKLLAENLALRGHEVAVYCIDNKENRITTEIINDVHVYRGNGGIYNLYKAYTVKGNIVYSLFKKILEIYNVSILKDIKNLIADFKPDIVHINCPAGISLACWRLLCKKEIATVFTIRDYFLDSPKNILENENDINMFYRLALNVYRLYSKSQSNFITAVTAPSEYTLQTMLKRGYFKKALIQKCIVNSVKVDMNHVIQAIEKKRTHQRRTFLYAGSITEEKGIPELMNAFMRTKTETDLYVCGEGNLDSYVLECQKADSRIQILGKLLPKQLADIYKHCDVLIIPSVWAEPFGRVIIEAAMNGLTVIGSNCGGIPEIIKQLKCGEVYDSKDIETLSELISDFATKDLTDYYSGIKENIEYYSITNQVNDFLDLYAEAIETIKGKYYLKIN